MKRLILFLLSATLIAGSLLVPSSASSKVYGDVDGDGSLGIKDVVSVIQHLAGWKVEKFLPANADFDSDGNVNLKDVVYMIQSSAGFEFDPEEMLLTKAGVTEVDFDVPEPTPTETVSSTEFGFDTAAADNGGAFNAAVAYLKEHPNTTLVIEPGVYRMTTGVSFSGLTNCVIDGGGSTFLFGANRYFTVNGGTDSFMMKNFTVDWDFENSYMLTSMVRVRAINDIEGSDSVRVEFEFFLIDDASYAVDAPWDSMIMYDPETLTCGAVKGNGDIFTADTFVTERELIEPNVVAATMGGESAWLGGEDTVWLVRHRNYGGYVFNTTEATNVTYKDITVYSAHGQGFGMSGENTHHIKLDGVTIGLNPENADWNRMSVTADAIHIKDMKGYFIIDNCDIGYQGDDCLNVHDNCGIVTERNGDVFVVKTTNGNPFRLGSVVKFKSSDTFADYDYTGTIVDYYTIDGKNFEMILDNPVPEEIGINAAVINAENNCGNYIIRNSYFHENRARGLLLGSSNGLVENNRFYRTQNAGINIPIDHQDLWTEGTGVDNLIIRNNVFDSCSVLAAWNNGSITFVATSYHSKFSGLIRGYCFRNILIADNTFVNTYSAAVQACGAENLTIIGNTIKNPNPVVNYKGEESTPAANRGMIQLESESFKNITVINNTWENSPYLAENITEVDAVNRVKEGEQLTEKNNNVIEPFVEDVTE